MFASLSDLIKIPAAVLAGIGLSVVFYEGLRLPLVGQVVPGVVWYRVDAATSNMVTKFDRDTLQAQIDEERRRRAVSDAASARAQERADATQTAKEAAEAEIERLSNEAAKKKLPNWSEEELQWLDQN
jgi:hypothetical protein